MPETTSETQTPPAAPTTPNPFETPKVEPKALEAPSTSNFMADLTKAFQTQVEDTPEPAPEKPTEVKKPEAPAPSEKPPTAEPPETFTPKAKERWRGREKEWDTERTSFQAKQKELETQLAEARKRMPELEDELTKTKEELTQRNTALERFDVERAPVYKEKILDQEEAVKQRLAKLELQPAEIGALLSGSITQREQALENPRLTNYRRSQLAQVLEKWDEIQDTKSQMLANGKKSLEEYTRQQAEAESGRKAQFIREAKQIYDDQCVQMMDKLEPFIEVAADSDKNGWNQGVAVRKQLAQAIYSGGLDRQQLAQAAIWAAAAPMYRQLLSMSLKKIEELNTQVAKMRGLAPGVRDSGGDTQVIQPARPASSQDFVKDLVGRFNKEAIP